MAEDPFGNRTLRANMHAARNWDDVTGESGPEDPDLSLVSVQALDGRPIAVLANFSMHYFGDRGISADYFGLFSEGLKARLAPDSDFVGMMSHGCSGDIWKRDYTKPAKEDEKPQTIDEYAAGLLDIALATCATIEHRSGLDLDMVERRMTLPYRIPDRQRLEWAQRIVEAMGDRPPQDITEVYAREQVLLHEAQQTEIVVQALRVGDVGIATTPCETYAITGLKVKAASPLPQTIVIELANGGDGYIPPPEQHLLGGYNTWAARSAGLEVLAEPKIAAACVELLEQVAGRPRRVPRQSEGPAAGTIRQLDPAAWWRLDEFTGPRAVDSSGHERDAAYEPQVTHYLEGPRSDYFCTDGEKNRSAMFAGGRLCGRIEELGESYSLSVWVWNGLPTDARDVTGWLFSRDLDFSLGAAGDHLGLGGAGENGGRLIFLHGNDPAKTIAGKTDIPRWEWRHIVFVRDRDRVKVYLNGELEIDTTAPAQFPAGFDRLFVGGRSDRAATWEGRLDEAVVFDRALSEAEVMRLTVR
jgi:hypothetical protein